MNATAVHATCLALVALDFISRTWRTQLFLHGAGHRLPFREVFVQGAIGEAASSLTPMRAGGEPARIWAMARQGVPTRVAVVAVGVEFLAVTVVIALTALVLGLTVASEWWAAAGPELVSSSARSWPWLVGVLAASMAAWIAVRRRRPELLEAMGAELAAARAHVRDLPARVHLASIPISLVNIGARVAILPVLAQLLDQPPPLAATVVGSFALLYAQAVIPTPGGAGAVELGFLGGAAGNLGSAEAALLLAWRLYTTAFGTALGVLLGAWRFRADVSALVMRRRRSGAAPTPEKPPHVPELDGGVRPMHSRSERAERVPGAAARRPNGGRRGPGRA